MQLLNLFDGIVIGAFIVSIGFSLYLWYKKIETAINRAFFFLGACISVYIILTLINCRHENPSDFIFFDKLANLAIILSAAALTVLLKNITGFYHRAHTVAVMSGLIIMTIFNFTFEGGLTFSSISSMEQIQLPWGEFIYSPVHVTSPMQYYVIVFVMYMIYFSVKSFRYAYKQGNGKNNTLVIWAIALGLGWPVIDNLLKINAIYHFMYLESFSFFFFIVIIYHRNVQSVINSGRIRSELTENERTLKLILDSTNDGIWDWDLEKNTVNLNNRYLSMLGYTKEEFPTERHLWIKLLHPDDQIRVTNGLEQFLQSKSKSLSAEFRMKTKWETWIWISTQFFVATTNKEGKPVRLIGSSTDITERKNAEEKIKRSEARFRTLAEASFEGIVIARNESIFDMNQQFLDIFGYNRSELIGKQLSTLVRNYAKAALQEQLTPGMYNPIELAGLRKDSSTFPMEIRARIISQDDDILNVCTVRDLTAQKEAESALQLSENNFRELFALSPIANVVVDLPEPHVVVAINEAGLRLFENSNNKVIGSPLEAFFGKSSSESILRIIHETGSLNNYETCIACTSDERRTVVLFSREVVFNKQPAVFLLVEDVTSRRNAEILLNNSLLYIDSLVNSLPIGIISINQDLHVSLFNESAMRFVLNQDDLQESHLYMKFKKLRFMEENIAKALKGPELSFEIIDYHADIRMEDMAHIFYVSVIPLQFQVDTGYVIMIEDTTEQRKMEQAMIQSEKVLSVAGLAAGMAHEINNPLGTIVQGCQNILRRVSTKLPKNIEIAQQAGTSIEALDRYFAERQVFEIIESMRAAAHRASEIIHSMLHFSRKSESKKVKCSINALALETLELAASDFDLKKKYDFKSIEIRKELAEDLPLITATITEIEQVLLNIIRNSAQAFSHMNNNERSPFIAIRSYSDSAFVCLEIQDNGPGIPEQIVNRIFEPFFTTKEVGEGTGLGLSVAYMIIQKNHNGQLSVESQEGAGTRFTIKLPIAPISDQSGMPHATESGENYND